MANPVVCSIARTPIGKFSGAFTPLTAMQLGAVAIAGAVDRSGLDPAHVDEVVFGHVLQAGQGQITSRQAAVGGGLPMTVPCTTINKVCLSGMSAIAAAARDIRLGEATFAVAGGMESMTNAPYVLPGARQGLRMGDAHLIDSMTHDGLWCAFDHCIMGESSDRRNAVLGIERPVQDEWAAESHRRAAEATASGGFADEVVPVEVPQRKGDPVMMSRRRGDQDRHHRRFAGGASPCLRRQRDGDRRQRLADLRRRRRRGGRRPGRRRGGRVAGTRRDPRLRADSPGPTPPCTSAPPRRFASP